MKNCTPSECFAQQYPPEESVIQKWTVTAVDPASIAVGQTIVVYIKFMAQDLGSILKDASVHSRLQLLPMAKWPYTAC